MPETGPIIVRKRKIVAGGHHGGSWKVAYADFVTAMMAFFMVMWIMGMDPEIKSMVQGYFNDPMGFLRNPPKSQTAFQTPGSPAPRPGKSNRHGADILDNSKGDRAELSELQKRFEKALQADADLKSILEHVELTLTEEGLRIEFMESTGAVFFESGRATILPEARKLIAAIAPILAKSDRSIVVEGHTDAAPYPGKAYTNWDLSTDRALAMRRALSEFGVGLGQFVEVRGYADTKLKKPEEPRHFSNRRVSVLLPFGHLVRPIKDLPKEAFETKLQGVFRKPLDAAPSEAATGLQ